MQKSEVNERIFRCLDNPSIHPIHFSQIGSWIRCQIGCRIGCRIGTVVQNIAYVWYSLHFLISCICVFVNLYLFICVFVYLTVGNISFYVLGPWAF